MTPLRCASCGYERHDSDDQPFGLTISYVATADGTVGHLDDGALAVEWSQAHVISHYVDAYLVCPDCGHTWKTRRRWTSVVAGTSTAGPADPA